MLVFFCGLSEPFACTDFALFPSMMKRMLFTLAAVLIGFQWSSFADEGDDVKKKAVDFIKLARQSEEFVMYGADQLNLKIAMAAVSQKQKVDIDYIKDLYASVQGKVTTVKREFASFQEFVDAEKESWPASGDLETDIQRIQEKGITLIEPHFTADADNEKWQKNKLAQEKFISKVGIAGIGTFMQFWRNRLNNKRSLKPT